MGTDRNTVIGFILLALLFFGYFYYTRQGQLALEKDRQHVEDSLSRIKVRNDSIAALNKPKTGDSAHIVAPAGNLLQDSTGQEQLVTLESDVLKVTFTSKGAQPKSVELKKYKTFKGEPLILENSKFNQLFYTINTGANQTAQTKDLLFRTGAVEKQADGSSSIAFSLPGAGGQTIEHRYILKPSNYMLDFVISMQGADKLVTQNTINLVWQDEVRQQEKNLAYERGQSQVAYVEDGDYDFSNLGNGNDKSFSKPVEWIAVKQQFFMSSLLAKNKFQSADIKWTVPADTTLHVISQAIANCRINLPAAAAASVPLQIYYGPTDYKILKSYDNKMHYTVPLGSGMFAFVKYINRGFVMPVFNFLSSHIASFGLVIALLTIIIRLLIAPITYQSYLSGAKMKLLKPEIDELKAKYGEDKQTFGMEQMKLFRSAGVNPLGGCIPALLQLPIFFALYNFFNSNIALRGQSFWWSKDLSSYDSIFNLPFNIPFYGDHVSLFTILAVATSLLISLYGMSNMQDNSNPMMKYLPFIFPVVLLGVFNNLPSALTWYYTVSNVITLLLQFVIQTYIIDHEKIMKQLQANKLKPATKSKWQERVEAMQQSNQKVQDLKSKTEKGRK